MIERGASWGVPATRPADIVVHGDDGDLADAVRLHRGALIDFEPSGASDLARALGLAPDRPVGATAAPHTEVPVDALELDDGTIAVNAVVFGRPPSTITRRTRRTACAVEVDRRSVFDDAATTVVVATGQFLGGADVVPRGHPGDGRVEVQVYALAPGERRAMRGRLPMGTHVPHPRITEATGRVVTVRTPTPMPLEVDGRRLGEQTTLTVRLRPGAYSLLL